MSARLVIAPFAPRHTWELTHALAASVEALSAWIPWLARSRASTLIERGQLGMFGGAGTIVGGAALQRRPDGGGVHLGYWLRDGAQGRGYAAEAVASITTALLAAGLDGVSMLVHPENERAGRVARRVGYQRRRETIRGLRVWTYAPAVS